MSGEQCPSCHKWKECDFSWLYICSVAIYFHVDLSSIMLCRQDWDTPAMGFCFWMPWCWRRLLQSRQQSTKTPTHQQRTSTSRDPNIASLSQLLQWWNWNYFTLIINHFEFKKVFECWSPPQTEGYWILISMKWSIISSLY